MSLNIHTNINTIGWFSNRGGGGKEGGEGEGEEIEIKGEGERERASERLTLVSQMKAPEVLMPQCVV